MHWQRHRVVDRILHRSEKATFAKQQDPHRFLWTSWAAKEAAFKYRQRLDPSIVFLPTTLQFSDGYVLGCGPIPIAIEIVHQPCWVHAITRHPDSITVSKIEEVGRGATSAEARQLAEALLWQHFGVRAGVTRDIINGRYLPPRFHDQGRYLLSLSHDGRFVAASISKIQENNCLCITIS